MGLCWNLLTGVICHPTWISFFNLPINASIYMFVDQDARDDFADMARDDGLILQISEDMEGESKKDKENRKSNEEKQRLNEKSRLTQKAKHDAKTTKSANVMKISEQMQQSLNSILKRLEGEEDAIMRKKLNQKAERIINQLEKANSC